VTWHPRGLHLCGELTVAPQQPVQFRLSFWPLSSDLEEDPTHISDLPQRSVNAPEWIFQLLFTPHAQRKPFNMSYMSVQGENLHSVCAERCQRTHICCVLFPDQSLFLSLKTGTLLGSYTKIKLKKIELCL
jgi:hypothetical protein